MRYYQPRETDTSLAKAVWFGLTVLSGAVFLMIVFLGLRAGNSGAVVLGLIIAVPALLLAGVYGWEFAGGKKKRKAASTADIKDPEARRLAEQMITELRAKRAASADGNESTAVAVVAARERDAAPDGGTSGGPAGATQNEKD